MKSWSVLVMTGVLAASCCGPAAAQEWRQAAEARIEQHRKGDLLVTVRDEAGLPVSGAEVHVRLLRHAFLFGTAINAGVVGDGPAMDLTSSDLDVSDWVCGVRFPLEVPQGATITGAHIQFTSSSSGQSAPSAFEIHVEDADDAVDFATQDVTSRSFFPEPMSWSPAPWLEPGLNGPDQLTPDLAPLLQGVVEREGWAPGNHVSFSIRGTGKRSARTIDASQPGAARLYVTYEGGSVESTIQTSEDDAEEFLDAENVGRYREAIVEHFNYVTLENALKWDNWEADRERAYRAIEWAESHDLPVRGHTLVWPQWSAIPGDVEHARDDAAWVRSRIEDHITEQVSALRGRILEWDVLNEPLHHSVLEDIVGFDARVDWFKLAHEADPDPRLFVNDFDILEGPVRFDRYVNLVHNLLHFGAPVQGIGAQGHFLGERPSPEQIWQRLEALSEAGLPVQITEFDMNSGWSSTQQAEHLESTLTVAFSHPNVTAFIMWGPWDRLHWLGNGPLFYDDWTLKPGGEAYIELVHNRWQTDERRTTDETGAADVRGFVGLHEVSVTVGDQVYRDTVDLSSDGRSLEIVAAAGTQSEIPDASRHASVQCCSPNPTRGPVTLEVQLPFASEVVVEFYDLLGRRVHSTEGTVIGPGTRGRVDADLAALPSGVYVYRVMAHHHAHVTIGTGRVVVVK